MNDITPAHELMGKVVVVVDLTELPASCRACPYHPETTFAHYCLATGNIDFYGFNRPDKRLDICPLRIVGR